MAVGMENIGQDYQESEEGRSLPTDSRSLLAGMPQPQSHTRATVQPTYVVSPPQMSIVSKCKVHSLICILICITCLTFPVGNHTYFLGKGQHMYVRPTPRPYNGGEHMCS